MSTSMEAPQRPLKSHLSRVQTIGEDRSGNSYHPRGDAFLGWRERPRSVGLTGSTIGGYSVTNASDLSNAYVNETLRARQKEHENLRRRYRPSALNPTHRREDSRGPNSGFTASRNGNSTNGGGNGRSAHQQRSYSQDRPGPDRRHSQVRGLQTSSIHRPENRIQKQDPYQHRAGPRKRYTASRSGTYHGRSTTYDSRNNRSYGSNVGKRRFTGDSDRSGGHPKRRWTGSRTHSGASNGSMHAHDEFEGGVSVENPDYLEEPLPNVEPAPGTKFFGFPYDKMKGQWPNAVKYFFREGGGASSKCGEVVEVFINDRNGEPVHQSAHNSFDKRRIVTAQVIGKLATKVCHIFLNGTGSGFMGDVEC